MTEKTLKYIEQAKLVHNDFYSYELVKNISRNTNKIEIICPIHGIFNQSVSCHINARQGCRKCAGNEKRTKESLLKQFEDVHGNKYSYGDFEYTGNKQKIPIICPDHGEFLQGVKEHYLGSGCPACAKNFKLDKRSFLIKLQKKIGDAKFGKLDFTNFEYHGYDILSTASCEKHGPFETTPHKLMSGYGCKRCVSNSSNCENEWLDSLCIEDLKKQHTIRTGEKAWVVDGYSPSTNTVCEFHGDFFHGNPKYFHPDDLNPVSKKTFGELYLKTKEKESLIKEFGYSYVCMWESDFKKALNKKIDPKYKDIRKEWYDSIRKRIEFEKLWMQADGIDDYDWGRFRSIVGV